MIRSMMKTNRLESQSNIGNVIFFTILVVGSAFWIATYYSSHGYMKKGMIAQSGQLGDSFGATNAFFTLLAMSAAGCAAYFQYSALQDQRRTNQATIAATIASNIAAWNDLTTRLMYTEKVEIPRLKLAITENRNRKLLEIYTDALIANEVPSVDFRKRDWNENQLKLISVDSVVDLLDSLHDTYTRSQSRGIPYAIEIIATNTDLWNHYAEVGGNAVVSVWLKHVIDTTNQGNEERVTKALQDAIENIRGQATKMLGMFKEKQR